MQESGEKDITHNKKFRENHNLVVGELWVLVVAGSNPVSLTVTLAIW